MCFLYPVFFSRVWQSNQIILLIPREPHRRCIYLGNAYLGPLSVTYSYTYIRLRRFNVPVSGDRVIYVYMCSKNISWFKDIFTGVHQLRRYKKGTYTKKVYLNCAGIKNVYLRGIH